MSLRGRLRALELLARRDPSFSAEPRCSSCGGPDPQASPIILVNLGNGEELRRCVDCSRCLDEQGRGSTVDADVIYLLPGHVNVPLPGSVTKEN